MKTRDLAAEQTDLKTLFLYLPWLKIRQEAAAHGLPYSTLTAYLHRAVGDPGFRPLRNAAHADIIWNILRRTTDTLAAYLPARPRPKRLAVAAAVLLGLGLGGCATTRPASYEYEQPLSQHHALRAEPYPSRIR